MGGSRTTTCWRPSQRGCAVASSLGGTVPDDYDLHPIQHREQVEVSCVAEVHDIRSIRSSSGQATDRIVIQTMVSWLDQTWTIDLTLADRSQMGFRMLVGREAIRGRMLVEPGRSYFGGRPKRKHKSK